MCRQRNGETLAAEQIIALRSELQSLGENDQERIAIANKTVASGWKSFYPIKKKSEGQKQKPQAKNRFNNFEQRSRNYSDLERQLLRAQEERTENA